MSTKLLTTSNSVIIIELDIVNNFVVCVEKYEHFNYFCCYR